MPDLDTLDTAGALDLWRRLAPKPARWLIQAEDEEIGKEKRKRCERKEDREKNKNRNFCLLLPFLFFWDSAIGRYRNGAGQLVSRQAVKQASNTFSVRAANQMGAIASRLVDGTIGLPEYASMMAQKVNAAHTASYASGAGGIARLTGDTLAHAEQAVGYHLGKLDGFVADVRRGGIEGDALIARSRLYGLSLSPTHEAAKAFVFKTLADIGTAIEERNVLGEADHCGPDPKQFTAGCSELAERGWLPRGTMPLPGHRTCRMNCKCRMDYRIVTTL